MTANLIEAYKLIKSSYYSDAALHPQLVKPYLALNNMVFGRPRGIASIEGLQSRKPNLLDGLLFKYWAKHGQDVNWLKQLLEPRAEELTAKALVLRTNLRISMPHNTRSYLRDESTFHSPILALRYSDDGFVEALGNYLNFGKIETLTPENIGIPPVGSVDRLAEYFEGLLGRNGLTMPDYRYEYALQKLSKDKTPYRTGRDIDQAIFGGPCVARWIN